MASLTVRAFSDFASLAPLDASLLALNLASRRPSAFDTPDYLRIAWDNEEFPLPDRKLLLLVAFAGDAPVGFLPLRSSTRRVFGLRETVIEFSLTHDADRLRIVARAEDERACAAAFYDFLFRMPDVKFVNLAGQEADSSLYPLPASVPRGLGVRLFPGSEQATVTLPPTLPAYLASLPSSSSRGFQKQVRKALRSGDITWVGSDEPASARALFGVYLDLERHMWKEKVSGIVGRSERRINFFREEMSDGLPFEMFVDLLLFRGMPIGGAVGGHFAGTTWVKETGYDEAFRRLSPGNLSMLMCVARAIERGSTSLNLLGGQGYYKARWGATITATSMVQIYRRPSAHYLKATLGDVGRRLGVLPRPPAPLDHNPVKRALSAPDDPTRPLPERDAEARHAEATLASIRENRLRITEYGAMALRTFLGLDRTPASSGDDS